MLEHEMLVMGALFLDKASTFCELKAFGKIFSTNALIFFYRLLHHMVDLNVLDVKDDNHIFSVYYSFFNIFHKC